MTIGEKHFQPQLSELSLIELESGRLLDDDSLKLIALLRARGTLDDGEWDKIKIWIRNALQYLSDATDGPTCISKDHAASSTNSDPRQSSSLEIDAARQCSQRTLPPWAAMWFWRLGPPMSREFWRAVNRAAGGLGIADFGPKVCKTYLEERFQVPLVELSLVEREEDQKLDDDSLRLLALLRSQGYLTDPEWMKVKGFLKDALSFLSVRHLLLEKTPDGKPIISYDDHPQNAGWLAIHAACHMARHKLPGWAALWLYWLRGEDASSYLRVYFAAKRLGYEKFSVP